MEYVYISDIFGNPGPYRTTLEQFKEDVKAAIEEEGVEVDEILCEVSDYVTYNDPDDTFHNDEKILVTLTKYLKDALNEEIDGLDLEEFVSFIEAEVPGSGANEGFRKTGEWYIWANQILIPELDLICAFHPDKGWNVEEIEKI